jgi:NADH-quinone oxidoreductase subunit J
MFNGFFDFLSIAENWVFMIFALLAIAGAIFMINLTKIIHMVVALALTFISLAGIYVLLYAEFIAFVQVLIYAGAISILMIFGIMMTKHDESDQPSSKTVFHDIYVFIGTLALFGIIFYSVQTTNFESNNSIPIQNNTLEIGKLLFNEFVIPFEIMSVLLTVAFIGAIVIAKREEE